jgi:hypothetical protein
VSIALPNGRGSEVSAIAAGAAAMSPKKARRLMRRFTPKV